MTRSTYIPAQTAIKTFRNAMAGLTCTLLMACVSAPSHGPGISSEVFDGLHAEGIKPPTGEASDFREQTKGKVAAATTLSIVGAVLGGGSPRIGQRNQAPADGYTVTQDRPTVFSGDELTAYTDANMATAEALRRKLANSGIRFSDQSRYGISSVEKFWGIDYEKMTDKDNYRLYYNIETSLLDGKKAILTYSCTGASDDKGSYAYWMDDDKQNVKLRTAVIGDICADRAMAAFGLKATAEK